MRRGGGEFSTDEVAQFVRSCVNRHYLIALKLFWLETLLVGNRNLLELQFALNLLRANLKVGFSLETAIYQNGSF